MAPKRRVAASSTPPKPKPTRADTAKKSTKAKPAAALSEDERPQPKHSTKPPRKALFPPLNPALTRDDNDKDESSAVDDVSGNLRNKLISVTIAALSSDPTRETFLIAPETFSLPLKPIRADAYIDSEDYVYYRLSPILRALRPRALAALNRQRTTLRSLYPTVHARANTLHSVHQSLHLSRRPSSPRATSIAARPWKR